MKKNLAYRLFRRAYQAIRWKSKLRAIGRYPSSIIDSQACEFGFEMYYHIGYAYHLFQKGLLRQSISCCDTACFYWFSPKHIERYKKRSFIGKNYSIDQVNFAPPDFSRWQVPNFADRYKNRVEFGFSLPLLLIFNKYNVEWDGPPINYFSKEFLISVAKQLRGRMQIVYVRPTTAIVHDHSEVLDLQEKAELARQDVILAEDLHARYSHLTFNELQLCLLAQSPLRFAVQGGACYLNALFPGKLAVLHRKGQEKGAGTYGTFLQMNTDTVYVEENETALWNKVQRDIPKFAIPDR